MRVQRGRRETLMPERRAAASSATCPFLKLTLSPLSFPDTHPVGSPCTMQTAATLWLQPPAPTTASSRACPATPRRFPSPTAACTYSLSSWILCFAAKVTHKYLAAAQALNSKQVLTFRGLDAQRQNSLSEELYFFFPIRNLEKSLRRYETASQGTHSSYTVNPLTRF